MLASKSPVICATPVIEIAVAHAILSRAVFGDDDRFFFAWDPYTWTDGGVPLITTTTYVLEELTRRNIRGVLHSFSWQEFEPWWCDRPLSIEEWRYGPDPLEPCAWHEVSVADLTPNLVLYDDTLRHMAARVWPMMKRNLAWARERYPLEILGGDWSVLLP